MVKNTVCKTASIKEDVTLGEGNIINPLVKIRATNGPIVIGNGNVFEEYVEVRNLLPPDEEGQPQTLYIGNDNLFECWVNVKSKLIGNGNTFGCRSELGIQSSVGDNCIILSKRSVAPNITLDSQTLVHGVNGEYKKDIPIPTENDTSSLAECLRGIISNYHQLQDM